jgi:hypothetical protein
MKKVILIFAIIFMSFLCKTQEETFFKWDTTIYTQPDNVKNTYKFYVHSPTLDLSINNLVYFRGILRAKAGKTHKEIEFNYTIPFTYFITVNPNTWAITWNGTQSLERSKVYFRQYIIQLQEEAGEEDK